jgi:serine/threonine protein kinase
VFWRWQQAWSCTAHALAVQSCSDCTIPHLADPWSCCPLQLDNILLHGDAPAILKLCDFGYSKDGETESDCKTACGTPEYMAPEVSIAHPARMTCMLLLPVPLYSCCNVCCSSTATCPAVWRVTHMMCKPLLQAACSKLQLTPLQVLKGEAYDGKAVDVWSCGCSLYILLCGDYP